MLNRTKMVCILIIIMLPSLAIILNGCGSSTEALAAVGLATQKGEEIAYSIDENIKDYTTASNVHIKLGNLLNIDINLDEAVNSHLRNEKYYSAEQSFSDVYEKFDDIEQVELNLNRGKLKIVSGDKLSIKGTNINEYCYSAAVEGKKLIIEEKATDNTVWNGNGEAFYILTVPSDTPLAKLTANCSNGSVSFAGISVNEVDFQVKKGSLEGFNLDAIRINVNSGMGSINLHNIFGQNIDIVSGMGSVNLSGEINGDDGGIRISSPMGSVNLSLDNDPSDFHYNLAKRSSSVNINGVKASKYSYINNAASESKYGLEIGAGKSSVEIHFHNDSN